MRLLIRRFVKISIHCLIWTTLFAVQLNEKEIVAFLKLQYLLVFV